MTHPIARNIVDQLGDLYMESTVAGSTERYDFVGYRQKTNDQADQFVTRLLREYAADVLEDAANRIPGSEIDPPGLNEDWLREEATRLRAAIKENR